MEMRRTAPSPRDQDSSNNIVFEAKRNNDPRYLECVNLIVVRTPDALLVLSGPARSGKDAGVDAKLSAGVAMTWRAIEWILGLDFGRARNRSGDL